MRTAICSLTRCFTSKRVIPFAAALFAMAVLAAPASAQNCLQDQYKAAGNTQTLSCTANDVRVAKVTGERNLDGTPLTKCLAGTTFSFLADFEVVTTSNKTRSNIGLYFGTGTGAGQNGALSGACTDSIIAPLHPCPGNASVMCGSDNYHELDAPPDTCGDTSSADSSGTFGTAAQGVTIQIDNVTCPLSGTSLSLPVCTSWQVPGKTLLCESPGPSYPYQNAAIPGSPSKCSCGTLSIPVIPVTASATVAKSCETALSTGAGLTSCDAGAEGSTVTYHVAITNTSDNGGIVIDQICDNRYGNVFTAAGYAGSACPAGTLGTVASTTCSASTPGDIAMGGTGTCDFTAAQGENATVTDTVTVNGHSDLVASSTFGPTSSNTVTVTSSDAPSTATITKGLVSTAAGCATVRYSVDVANTSGADETLTLSASGFMDDGYGSITTVHGSVLGTTCGVAAGNPGLGTLSGTTASAANGGALPATIAPSGDYKCQFDAQFCGALGTVPEFGTGTCTAGFCSAGQPGSTVCTKDSDCDVTCNGIKHTNTVSGTITGDESEAVTQTDKQFNVSECFASFSVSQ
jgi:hypothetical protein